MDKNLLDKMSGQELKEMIDSKEIIFDELDNAALEKILDFETDMLCFGNGDMTTIRRCSELLNARNDFDTLNDDKFISIIDKAQSERVIIVDEESQVSPKKVIKKRNVVLRRIGLVAAILTLMIATTTVVAAAFGINIFEYIKHIAGESDGTAINVDEFTFHNGGEIKKFSSIEEMVESEALDIMYPTKLPKDVSIKSVVISQSERGNEQIQILTNNENINIFIEPNGKEPNGSHLDSVVFETNGLKYYIFQESNFFASCYHNDVYYIIQAKKYDELILIINNMKE